MDGALRCLRGERMEEGHALESAHAGDAGTRGIEDVWSGVCDIGFDSKHGEDPRGEREAGSGRNSWVCSADGHGGAIVSEVPQSSEVDDCGARRVRDDQRRSEQGQNVEKLFGARKAVGTREADGYLRGR